MTKNKKQIIKEIFFIIVWFGICYYFIPRNITAWLFPWQCKEIVGDINPNLFHILAYVIPGYFIARYYLKWYSLIIVSLIAAFGGELFQVLIQKRSFGGQDFLFNCIGIIVGIILWKINSGIKIRFIRVIILISVLIVGFLLIIFSKSKWLHLF